MLVALPGEGGAGLTLDQTTQLYGTAASVNYISPLFLGLILDRMGPRTCSAVSNATVAIGCMIFASASQFSSYAIGICLVAFGGPGVQTSLIHLGNLFPSRRFFVMGMVAETICLSFAVLPLMDVVWESTPPEFSFRWTFGILAVTVAVSALFSVLLWTDTPYEAEDDSEKPKRSGSEDFGETTPKEGIDGGDGLRLQDLSFKKQLTSGVYIRIGIFFVVTSFWANFYIATVTTELGDQHRFNQAKQHDLESWLGFIDAGAIIFAPLSGYMLDSVGFGATAILTISLGVLQNIFLLIAGTKQSIMVASFVCYAVFRAFLFPYFFASLSKKIGFRYFGALSGIAFCTSGITQLAIAPLALFVEGSCHEVDSDNEVDLANCTEGRWGQIHTIQILTLLALLLVPLVDICAEKQKSRNREPLLKPYDSYGSTDSHGSTELVYP